MPSKEEANYVKIICHLLITCLLLQFISCSSPSEIIQNVDLDQDGIWDIEDPFPGDTDNDGLRNDDDDDDDNDGVLDSDDSFPLDPSEALDTDKDGIGNNADLDDDGDGILDEFDVFPLNKDEWSDVNANGVGDNADPDDDGDGFADAVDYYPQDKARAGDHDGDGVDSLFDLDDDNDGYLDAIEIAEAADPLNRDSKPADDDSDGLTNAQESLFGSDKNLKDTDSDGLDDKVEYYLHTDPSLSDSDGDGYSDLDEVGEDYGNLPDYDRDGIIDAVDYYGTFVFRELEAEPIAEHDRFGVSTDSDGDIFVSNYLADIIYIFNNHGASAGQLSGNGFLGMNDLAVADDSYYVADTFNDQVVEIDPLDQIKRVFEHQPDGNAGGFQSPRGIDVAANGDIYVADTWNNRIQKYDNVKDKWIAAGYLGANKGEFQDPQDIAVSDQGIVAVADTGNFRVQLFDSNLKYLSFVDSSSLRLSPFDFRPRSVAFSPAGWLYIVDDASTRVVIVDDKGIYVGSFGSEGLAEGQFLYPTAVHVDKNGKVYVTDRYRVQIF